MWLGAKKKIHQLGRYAIAADYANVMVNYSWLNDAANSHFMIGYAGSQGDGGHTDSWPMIYSILWLRLLGYENLLPQQQQILGAMRDWYHNNKLNQYGLPLNSRKTYTKDDWSMFLAAAYYDAGSQQHAPQPSQFSTELFSRLFAFANDTQNRVPLSDWTMTEAPNVAGFAARPVYGAMYCSCSTRPLFDFELLKKMQVCTGACGKSEGERSGGSKQRAECEGQEGFRRRAPQV
jgi:hypothetical protein